VKRGKAAYQQLPQQLCHRLVRLLADPDWQQYGKHVHSLPHKCPLVGGLSSREHEDSRALCSCSIARAHSQICMCRQIQIHNALYMHGHARTHKHTRMCAHKHTHPHPPTCTRTFICLQTRTHKHANVCTTRTHLGTHTHTHIHTHTLSHTHTQDPVRFRGTTGLVQQMPSSPGMIASPPCWASGQMYLPPQGSVDATIQFRPEKVNG
jgi:hypothetical protein